MSTLIAALREANKSDDTRNLKDFCEDQDLPDELTTAIWDGVESFVWSPKNKSSEDGVMCIEAIDTLEFYFDKGFETALVTRWMKKNKERTLDVFFELHKGGKGGGGGAMAEIAMRSDGATALRTSFSEYFKDVSSKKAAKKMISKKKLLAKNKRKKAGKSGSF